MSDLTLTCTDNPINVWCCTLFTHMRTFTPLTWFSTIHVTLARNAEYRGQHSWCNEQSVMYINVWCCTLFTHICTLLYNYIVFTHMHWISYLTFMSYPNFFRRQLFVDMRIFSGHVELLKANCCTIRKISQRFGRKWAKELKMGVKISI